MYFRTFTTERRNLLHVSIQYGGKKGILMWVEVVMGLFIINLEYDVKSSNFVDYKHYNKIFICDITYAFQLILFVKPAISSLSRVQPTPSRIMFTYIISLGIYLVYVVQWGRVMGLPLRLGLGSQILIPTATTIQFQVIYTDTTRPVNHITNYSYSSGFVLCLRAIISFYNLYFKRFR